MPTLHTRLSRPQVQAALAQVGAILAGRAGDSTGLARQLQLAVGTEALAIVKEAFIAKSRGGTDAAQAIGGTDAAGITWEPLSPRYVAYGRRHPGLKRKHAGERPRGLLTDTQDKRWRQIYAQALRRQSGGGMVTSYHQGNAAAIAWTVLKAEGAVTIFEKYSSAPVEIGRDTGRLFNSLSPGTNHPDQVLRPELGAVAVGTNVSYAGPFHARRPLWPAEGKWPQAWLDRLQGVLEDGIALMVERLVA